MIITIDIDGTLADLHTVWLDWYNKDHQDNLKAEDITDWDITKFVKPGVGDGIFDYLKVPAIYQYVEPMPGALYCVEYLRTKGRVVFCTAANEYVAGVKYGWLVRHGFLDGSNYRDYIEMEDKWLLRADILIDDCCDNIKAFKGGGILYTRPWNKKEGGFLHASRLTHLIEIGRFI